MVPPGKYAGEGAIPVSSSETRIAGTADPRDVPIEHAAGASNVREPGTVVYYHEGDEGLTLDERWREATRPSPVGFRYGESPD